MAQVFQATADDLVLCRSDAGDGGWSLHAPETTDEQIATGDALPLVDGPAEWDGEQDDWNRPNDADGVDQLRFEIVKHVIGVRVAENKAASEAKARADQRQQIMAILADKEMEGLKGKSADELRELLKGLV